MEEIKDCNGKVLANGDAVILTKDLDAKGSNISMKRGTVVKNIKLVEDDSEHIQCRMGKFTIFIKTCFLKKKK